MGALPFNTGRLVGDHMQVMGYVGKGAAHGKNGGGGHGHIWEACNLIKEVK
jgi:hypothetical protein